MKRQSLILSFVGAALLWGGCSVSHEAISLPEGDPAAGKAAFVTLKCYACHTVAGHDFPAPYATPPAPVVLGAESKRPTRNLVINSIINPSHLLEPGYEAPT